jgi:hypothetical protein
MAIDEPISNSEKVCRNVTPKSVLILYLESPPGGEIWPLGDKLDSRGENPPFAPSFF